MLRHGCDLRSRAESIAAYDDGSITPVHFRAGQFPLAVVAADVVTGIREEKRIQEGAGARLMNRTRAVAKSEVSGIPNVNQRVAQQLP